MYRTPILGTPTTKYIFSFLGVPEGQGRRAMAWRMLLNYLPEGKREWKDYLTKQRNTYAQFLGKLYEV